MIQFTEKAKERALFFLQDKDPKAWALRIRSRGPQDFGFSLDPIESASPLDHVVSLGTFNVVYAKELEETLQNANVDFLETSWTRGFKVEPSEQKKETQTNKLDLADPKVKKIVDLLNSEINPAITSHGGFAELVALKDNTVYLKMGGGCQGCASSQATLRNGIELRIKEEVPEIVAVVDQTDHASGANPYY